MIFEVCEVLKFRTPKGEFEFEPGQFLDLPEAKADPLIKSKRIAFLSNENYCSPFQSIFEKTVNEVAGKYLPGTLEMIRADFPDLAGEIEEAEDRVNDLWLKAVKGPVDVGTFREAVDR